MQTVIETAKKVKSISLITTLRTVVSALNGAACGTFSHSAINSAPAHFPITWLEAAAERVVGKKTEIGVITCLVPQHGTRALVAITSKNSLAAAMH